MSVSFVSLIDSDTFNVLIDCLGLHHATRSLSAINRASRTKVSAHYLLRHAEVQQGRPVETSGRRLCNLLEIARFLVFDLHCVSLSPQAAQLVRSTGSLACLRSPLFYAELGQLNAGMYTYWDSHMDNEKRLP